MYENQLLTQKRVDQMIRRMAYQIYENHMHEKYLMLIGVDAGGRNLANTIKNILSELSPLQLSSHTLKLNKSDFLEEGTAISTQSTDLFYDKPVILCDDVLHTGKTLAYSLLKLLELEVRKVETAALILRDNQQFPIHATYYGYQLATSINEHVNVVSGKGVFLI